MSEWKPRSGQGEAVAAADAGSGKGVHPAIIVAIGGIGCFVMVGVIGVLAAIAIPNFLAMQLRSKRAEAPITIDALRTVEKAYHAEFGVFFEGPACPEGTPGRERRPWVGDCTAAYEAAGWAPDADLRCSYVILSDSSSEDPAEHEFTVQAVCDVDGDDTPAVYEGTRAERASRTTPNNVY